MTLEEFAVSIGYTPMEDGRFMAPDGESFIGAEEFASLTRGGLAADQIVDGSPVQRVANWAGGEDDQNVQRELAYLKSFGIEPVNHPELGWIVPDDARLHQAHPDQNSDSIFDYGPILLGGGLAALSAGSGAAGTGALSNTGSVAAGSNVPTAVGG